MEHTVKTIISEICIGIQMNLMRVMSIEQSGKRWKGWLLAGSHSILNRWRNNFSQLQNEHGLCVLRQTEIHSSEPKVCEPRASDVEKAVEKPKRYISPGNDEITAELIQVVGRTIPF